MSTELKRHLDSLGYSHPPVDEEFRRFMYVERHRNGGALVLHAYQGELDEHMDTPDAHTRFARAFLQEAFREEPKGVATYVMAIVHEAAAYLPEFVGYLGERHGDLVVKSGHLLRKAEVQTTTAAEYAARVKDSYSHGTYRCGPLLQLSLVGQVAEESGRYFPEFLDLLERCPFLALTLPWGPLCSLGLAQRNVSDDGPILWVRPGEQMIPTGELGPTPKKKRNTGAAELQSLYGSRTNERRETLFEDRTHCHADHVVFGSKRETTAAVGVLKAVGFCEER
eukprot:Em0014g417a